MGVTDSGIMGGTIMNEEEFILKMQERTRVYIPEDELNKIHRSTVAIMGCGGIGGTAVEMLARWGIKRFRLVDKDKFEISNMNRQLYATVDTLGHWKADTAAKRIQTINPFAEVEMVLNEKLNKENTKRLVEGADIVLHEADTRSSDLLVHQASQQYGVPLVSVNLFYMGGVKVQIYDYRNPRQRGRYEPFSIGILNRLCKRLFDTTKKDLEQMNPEDLDSLDEFRPTRGSLNPTCTVASGLAVSEAIKLLTGRGRIYCHPKEVYMDLFTWKIRVQHQYSFRKLLVKFWERKDEIRRNLRFIRRERII